MNRAVTSSDGRVKVEWVNINEGIWGDYDPSNPEDVPLLRYDSYIKEGDEWVDPGDGSYCTLTPADTPDHVLLQLAQTMADELSAAIDAGSFKRTAESLSWTSPDKENH